MPRVKSRLFCFTILLTKRLCLLLINTLDGLLGVAWQRDMSPRARNFCSGETTVWIESLGLIKWLVAALVAAGEVGRSLVIAANGGAATRRSLLALEKSNLSSGIDYKFSFR